eukprot:s2539_g6.t1
MRKASRWQLISALVGFMEPTESDAFEVPKPPETDGPEEVEEPEKKRHALPSWAVLPWLALLAGLLLVPLSIGAEVAAELRVETSGLVKAAGGGTAAAAGATTQSTLQELQTLPEADLRRIRDCSFVHHGTFHRLRVASLVRTRTDVTIVAPDRATLQIGPELAKRLQEAATDILGSSRAFTHRVCADILQERPGVDWPG